MKILKILGIIVLVLVVALVATGMVLNESIPEGTAGPDADSLAVKMTHAVDKAAWDTTTVIQWNFGGRRSHIWDKDRHYVQVTWGKHKALVNINEKKGVAYKDGQALTGEDNDAMVIKAWEMWANDSYWLNPIVKVFDPGTERKLVKWKDGSDALLITYTSGGVTPGDSYLWIVDENGLAKAWKMWVKIIPIGGVKTTWDAWITLPTGAKVCTTHGGIPPLKLTDVKSAQSIEELAGSDIFEAL